LYTYGQITYDDVFDRTHETDFCFRWDPKLGAGFTRCDTFNEVN
jgi:hypothetical protein